MAESLCGETKPKQTKMRLLDACDWFRFLDYYKNVPLELICDKLDNHFLQKLYQHFFTLICQDYVPGLHFLHNSLELIKNLLKSLTFGKFNRMYIESNPLPPLKRYKGESWKQHPLEPLD